MSTPRRPLILGPGSLTFGEPGSPLDMSCQLTSCKFSWEVTAEEALQTLCGTPLPGQRTYSGKIAGSVALDIEKDGTLAWTYAHRGKAVPFEFTPRNDQAQMKVTGVCIVDPLDIGGDVGKRAMDDFEWSLVGEPILHMPDDDTQHLG